MALAESNHIAEFMNREMRLADWVLVLCSPSYQSKVRATEDGERLAGVGWETRLLTGGMLVDNQKKVLAVLAKGKWSEAAPDALKGQLHFNLSVSITFESTYRELLQAITGTSERAPALGQLPPNLSVEPAEALRGSSARAHSTRSTGRSVAAIPSISVDLEVMTTDRLKKVIFGLDKSTDTEGVNWVIEFQFHQREKKTEEFGDPLVKLKVDVKKAHNAAAQETAVKGLNSAQSEHLLGPAMVAAQRLNEGKTTEDKVAATVERTLPKRNA
jgi:hypothetical protein